MARICVEPWRKFEIIDKLPFKKIVLCEIANVSRSGYYAWKKSIPIREQKAKKDRELAGLIEVSCGNKIGIYGYRRVTMKLTEHGHTINHKRIARIMEIHGLQARIRRKNPYKRIMKKTQEHRTLPNLLDRQFYQTEPEHFGGTDITYIWVPKLKRFVYLSAVKDFATGEILAHKVSSYLTMSFVLKTIDYLSDRLGAKAKDFLLHSDQGVHYTYPGYQQKLKKLNMIQSMSRKGNCIDNASTESFFGHMKDEIDLSECSSLYEVEIAIATHMSYHNSKRRQWDKKKMTPIQYRDHLLVELST